MKRFINDSILMSFMAPRKMAQGSKISDFSAARRDKETAIGSIKAAFKSRSGYFKNSAKNARDSAINAFESTRRTLSKFKTELVDEQQKIWGVAANSTVANPKGAEKELAKTELKGLFRSESYSEKLQSLMIKYIFSDDKLRNKVVLKGGAFMSLAMGSPRSSKDDLDLALLQSITVDEVKARIDDIIENLKLGFENEDITARKRNGHNFIINVNGSNALSIQVQPNSRVLKKPKKVVLNLPVIDSEVRATVINSTEQLAEKVIAVSSRKRQPKQVNDIYDMYYLISNGTKFDLRLIAKKLGISAEEAKAKVEDILIEYLSDKQLAEIWDVHTRTFVNNSPEFETMAQVLVDAWISQIKS
ncbi:MAG: nucleotidyl transferase AbiEii/AbiGii toxin family protein [Candidatus Micrarchaeaceae archaeon]